MAEPETPASPESEIDSLIETVPPEIPNRLFFRIGDVAELAGVETHVLRFWESEFPKFSPKKTSTGQRQYRRKDVEAVLEIKRLLYTDGYTIAGARKVLRQRAKTKRRAPEPRTQPVLLFSEEPPVKPKLLVAIKEELRAILTLLSRR
jgi:DNA-binding transcriptional MerR regulator